MNVVDSSGWLEYFADSDRADLFAKPIEDTEHLIVPSISVYEVFKKLLIEFNEDTALTAIAHMQIGKVIDLDQDLAMTAARISVEEKIPMADSIIWATTLRHGATLWTQDEDFKNIKGNVKYFSK
ncbi:type II toxin-antitoxin system VapC family toxin [Leptonema illini]|uniref:PilT protein domain protein n=1 Tax=Leptonema illini DSM 21528 TaxID=929563 RepID=H2CBP2_9LEPT|nr:type II toxin-antitoxin system VapC family toxin [Leptonema illini]EHQ07417.1 PilT protein domain protein [Leptonema illini DSM 21528]